MWAMMQKFRMWSMASGTRSLENRQLRHRRPLSGGRKVARSLGTVACALSLALGPSAGESAQAAPGAGPMSLRADHPRLLLDAARVGGLRQGLDTTHRFLWERYLRRDAHELKLEE